MTLDPIQGKRKLFTFFDAWRSAVLRPQLGALILLTRQSLMELHGFPYVGILDKMLRIVNRPAGKLATVIGKGKRCITRRHWMA